MNSTTTTLKATLFTLLLALFVAFTGTMAIGATESSGTAGADAAQQLVLLPQSELWLEGTSTLHAYSARANNIKVTGRLPTNATQDLAAAIQSGKASLELTVPVKGLHSDKNGLDSNLYKAMKADKHPDIRFRLTGYRTHPAAKPGVFTVRATGRLTIAGVEKEVELDGTLSNTSDRIQLQGKRELKMTDYGIEPPVMFMGALKTGDQVVIHYNIALGLK